MSNERPLLGDRPTLETQVALTQQALTQYMESDREWKKRIEKMLQEALDLAVEYEKIQQWVLMHDRWHGPDDEALIRRIMPVVGWKLVGGGVIIGAGLATIVGVAVQLTLRLS